MKNVFPIIAAMSVIGHGTATQSGVAPVAPGLRNTVIVGRAVCVGSTWLLTADARLIQFAHSADRVTSHQVRELRPGDPFWGLACLDDGSVWTLATGHVLARLSPDGAIVERRQLRLPHVELFGFRDRFVFLSLPIVSGRSVLAAATRRDPEDLRPWIGLVGRPGFGSAPQLTVNLVGCGIPSAVAIPCWFGDQSRVSIGDGVSLRTVSLPFLAAADIDQAAPIRDVALVAGGAMWVLAASSATSGHRVGVRLTRVNSAGVSQRSRALAPAARLILTANAVGCTLLTTTGSVMHVTEESEESRQ